MKNTQKSPRINTNVEVSGDFQQRLENDKLKRDALKRFYQEEFIDVTKEGKEMTFSPFINNKSCHMDRQVE